MLPNPYFAHFYPSPLSTPRSIDYISPTPTRIRWCVFFYSIALSWSFESKKGAAAEARSLWPAPAFRLSRRLCEKLLPQ